MRHTRTKKACKLLYRFTRFSIDGVNELYFFQQTSYFFVSDRFLFSFIINSEEGDNSIFYTDYRRMSNHPCAMAFTFPLVADYHANFTNTIAKISSLGRVLS